MAYFVAIIMIEKYGLLSRCVVQTIKLGLRKYDLLHDNYSDWNFMLLLIAMNYHLVNKHLWFYVVVTNYYIEENLSCLIMFEKN